MLYLQYNKFSDMNILSKIPVTISIGGTESEVVATFLRVFLANSKLADKQLEVTTLLVTKYAAYINDGVKEPYASALLFSTDTRKELYKSIGLSSAHFTNTLRDLTKKNIIAKENGNYVMNPAIVPASSLTFKFSVNAK